MRTLIELFAYLTKKKKFYLLPIFLLVVLAILLLVVGQNPIVAPFIYTLF